MRPKCLGQQYHNKDDGPKCLGQQYHNKDDGIYCEYCKENGTYACEWDKLYMYVPDSNGKRYLERMCDETYTKLRHLLVP